MGISEDLVLKFKPYLSQTLCQWRKNKWWAHSLLSKFIITRRVPSEIVYPFHECLMLAFRKQSVNPESFDSGCCGSYIS